MTFKDKTGRSLVGAGQVTDIDEDGDEMIVLDAERVMLALQTLVGFAFGIRQMCVAQGVPESVERIDEMLVRCHIKVIEPGDEGTEPTWEFEG